MLRFYQVDLLDLWRGRITPRRVAVLTRQLPAGSATNISLGSHGAWTPAEHLAATAVDVLQIANWQRGGGKGQQPKRLPRPGDALAKKTRGGRIAARAAAYKRRQRREA